MKKWAYKNLLPTICLTNPPLTHPPPRSTLNIKELPIYSGYSLPPTCILYRFIHCLYQYLRANFSLFFLLAIYLYKTWWSWWGSTSTGCLTKYYEWPCTEWFKNKLEISKLFNIIFEIILFQLNLQDDPKNNISFRKWFIIVSHPVDGINLRVS